MTKWLSEQWMKQTLEMAADQPERPGASVRLQYVITGGPDGDVRYYWQVENGKLVDCQLGDIEDPDITLTEKWDDAKRIQKGELGATAAFMQGKLKASGNLAKLMSLMPITGSPEYKALQANIDAITDYE
jgi:putative sterol carrier protein